eukprot:gene1629-biopygen1507
MPSIISPDRFSSGDFNAWLRHFQRCAQANDWDEETQLTKLPAFLQGPAATYYDTIDDHLLTSLKSCFAPAADREKYYREFEEQRLRTAEDPALFLWRLKEALKNAEPDLSPSAFDALLRRQFFRGLPEEIQLKLLESDPTPSLTTMTHFAQRFRSLRNLPASSCSAVMSDSSLPTNNRESHQPPNQLETITNIVQQLAENQAQLVAAISPQPSQTRSSHGPGRRPTGPVRCFFCGEEGHVVRDCAHRRRSPRCSLCSGWGHNATICANNNNHHNNHNHNHIPSEDEHQHRDGLRAHQQTHRDCTLVDTGSMKSIVDFQSFQRILEHCTHNNLEHPVLRESNIQLYAGQQVGKFVPVVESIDPSQHHSGDSVCASVSCQSVIEPSTLKELQAAISPCLTANEREQLLNTLPEFPDVFNNRLGHTSVTMHKIDTGNSPPIRQYPRRLPYHYRSEVDQQVADMLAQSVIQPSTSPWASPVVLVKKKDGSYRFCIDYRKLNSITKQDASPLPRVDDLLDAINGYSMCSTLDLRSGYWQVSMTPEDREKTAVMTPNGKGHPVHPSPETPGITVLDTLEGGLQEENQPDVELVIKV